MAAGNTFGATALSSYGGFWIALAISFTPGGFNVMSTLEEKGGGTPDMFYDSLGLFLMVFPLLTYIHIYMYIQSILTEAGLVHLHIPPRPLHAEIHLRLRRYLHHSRHRLPAPRNRLHPPQRLVGAQQACHPGRWVVRAAGSVPLVVCLSGRYSE